MECLSAPRRPRRQEDRLRPACAVTNTTAASARVGGVTDDVPMSA